jgi:hypothetical protein
MKKSVQKLAFIHYAKVAGRYMDYYLQRKVFDNRSTLLAAQTVKSFNSWVPPLSMGRDWNEEELLQLAANRHPLQCPSPEDIRIHYGHCSHDYLARQYVHNHHYSWSRATIRAFGKQGWCTVMFLRDPAEIFCSLWTWMQGKADEVFSTGYMALLRPLNHLSLDSFIREMITNPKLSVSFSLPDYVDDIDYVAEFSDAGFGTFLEEKFGHHYQPEHVGKRQHFASGNPGFAACREKGLISAKTQMLLDANDDVCRVRERLASPS